MMFTFICSLINSPLYPRRGSKYFKCTLNEIIYRVEVFILLHMTWELFKCKYWNICRNSQRGVNQALSYTNTGDRML